MNPTNSSASTGQTTATDEPEDPLIAAIPPNTDYITYLTILEYQLKPHNLATLNRLLQDDDGTLAAEIGWDLLKLILPILRVNPDQGRECLDIIARRGNPREVIIRVAEELEGLARIDSDGEADSVKDDDGLAEFTGEAPRVHLGDMTLQGMPDLVKSEAQDNSSEHDQGSLDVAVEELTLQALLTMLGLLHPRIKTQHPSRFLATSLPAALAAYRRLSMTAESTSSFLNALTKLSTKKRPALPPRISTSNVLGSTSVNVATSGSIVSAPLPDPESRTEKDTVSHAVASNEAAINQRLVQAVLLEIVEEYTAASADPQPPLTARLRAHLEPSSITSVRRSQLESLVANEQAGRIDSLRRQFVTTIQDVGLDIPIAIESLNQPLDEEAEVEEDTDYPTSPAQIPFSATGLLFAFSAQQYLMVTAQQPSNAPTLSTKPHRRQILEAIDRQYENDMRLRHSSPAIDSVLSLLYIIFCGPTTFTNDKGHSVDDETLLLAAYNILQDIFTSCPDAELRDNAYHVATHLLHGHCQRATRLKIIKGLLETDVTTTISSIQEAQVGNLRSIAVDWLKDEIFPTHAIQITMSRISDDKERGLPLRAVVELSDLLFSANQIKEIPDGSDGQAMEQVLADFAADMPFHISRLNLLCLVARSHKELGAANTLGSSASTSDVGTTEANLDVFLAHYEDMLTKLEKWKDYLVARLSQSNTARTSAEGGVDVDGISLPDIFALEDAVGRAREMLNVES